MTPFIHRIASRIAQAKAEAPLESSDMTLARQIVAALEVCGLVMVVRGALSGDINEAFNEHFCQPSRASDASAWRSWESDPPPRATEIETRHRDWLPETKPTVPPKDWCPDVATNWLWRYPQPPPPKVKVTEEIMKRAMIAVAGSRETDIEATVRSALEAVAPMIAEQVRNTH